MYLKSRVKIPDVHGKLTRLRRGDVTYIKYEYDRYYDSEKKYTYPQRATIGKLCTDDDTMMIPNEVFFGSSWVIVGEKHPQPQCLC